ncbi:MAG: YvcK family protein [Desulfobulbaceae bacterium]|nr:YvcK family protein [Desulfobulbaceae bacterium]
MQKNDPMEKVEATLRALASTSFTALDLLPHGTLAEKVIELVLAGSPPGPGAVTSGLAELAATLSGVETDHLKVVVFGGGTGLANVIGGDSRAPDWPRSPFQGLKEVFPQTSAVVCVTDDGGSTGELLKDLPLIALGDLRHVLLASIRFERLASRYRLSFGQVQPVVATLHGLFNCRFEPRPASAAELLRQHKIDLQVLPAAMRDTLQQLLDALFGDARFEVLLTRPHCLGNLLLAVAIYLQLPSVALTAAVESAAIVAGLRLVGDCLGVEPGAVLPCTTTPARLKVLYANGVLVTGEDKSGQARRGCPVDRVFVEFAGLPQVLPEVCEAIAAADIILFAPGSLYTSIVPVLQVPGLAAAVRENRRAMKVLIANLWGQRGETDLVREEPGRRFYVSDLLAAYQRNIPGGVRDLFREVVVLGLHDIPGSILQSYAFENKVPIYLDRERVTRMGFNVVETRVFSQRALAERQVVQHDPAALATAIRTLWGVRGELGGRGSGMLTPCYSMAAPLVGRHHRFASERLAVVRARLGELAMGSLSDLVADIFWRHADIPLAHLDYLDGIELIGQEEWCRSQRWDNVFSFYDPLDRRIKIRQDMVEQPARFEIAFLVALGQSLLGNYAVAKKMAPVEQEGELIGHAFRLTLREPGDWRCFLTRQDIERYLVLARMRQDRRHEGAYFRLINGTEEFTPPGLLFGLTYAWYLDNRFASHIEYKMAITRAEISDLVPAQVKMATRRQALTEFFRKQVFLLADPLFEERACGEICHGGGVG